MKKVKFTAEDVDFTSSNEIESVFLFNSEEERVLVFQHDPVNGADTHYIELDDQSFGTYNGVDEITLFSNKVHVKLNKEGKKALKCDEITVGFDLNDEKVEELKDSLSRFFKDEFKLDKTAKTNSSKDISQKKELIIKGKDILTLPENVSEMVGLEKVELIYNPNLDLEQACAILGKLPMLKSLTIVSATLVPQNIGDLENLEYLHIYDLTVSQMIPKQIGKLKNLKYLRIASESKPFYTIELTVPDEINQLTKLEKLYICAKKWNLPDNIGNLVNLKILNLCDCELKLLPPDIVKLESLKELYLNNINSPDLDWADAFSKISQLEKLGELTITFDQQITNDKIAGELGLCKQLKKIKISGNVYKKIPLILPDEFYDLTELIELEFGYIYSFQIPEDIRNLKSLKVLTIIGCKLQSIPESIGELSSLKSLTFYHCNNLQSLPKSLVNLTKLKSLNLYNNSPLSDLPEPIKRMKNLKITSN